MTTITTNSNQFEDSTTLISEDGNVLEIVVSHLPGSKDTFTVGTYDRTIGPEESYQTLYTCPVQAA